MNCSLYASETHTFTIEFLGPINKQFTWGFEATLFLTIYFTRLDCRIVVLSTIHWDHYCTNHALWDD